jgi:hypothetical protein
MTDCKCKQRSVLPPPLTHLSQLIGQRRQVNPQQQLFPGHRWHGRWLRQLPRMAGLNAEDTFRLNAFSCTTTLLFHKWSGHCKNHSNSSNNKNMHIFSSSLLVTLHVLLRQGGGHRLGSRRLVFYNNLLVSARSNVVEFMLQQKRTHPHECPAVMMVILF